MYFLPMKTVYECNYGRSTSYASLAFKHKLLTLDREFTRHRFQTTNRTPFKEITIADFDTVKPPTYDDLLSTTRAVPETQSQLFQRIRVRLKDAIYEHWTPGITHIMFHSSGLDSRCLSWLIKELHREHGDEWLGTIVFVCSKWEGPVFKQIMEYQGWQPDQYHVAYEGCNNEDYYAPTLTNFDVAWEQCDGALPLAVNLYWYTAESAIEAGLIPDGRIQTLAGQWGNTVFDYGSTDKGPAPIDKITQTFYKSTLCQRPMYSEDHITPYAALPLIKVVLESSIVLGKKLRPMFVEYLDPTLATFTNMNADGDRFRPIAKWIIKQMEYDYRTSWYGQNVHPEAKVAHKNTEYQGFWYHWSLASFCKELKRRGIRVH